MKLETIRKIIDWFIEDTKENIAWSDADVSEAQILQEAINKTDDLIKKCFKGDSE